MFCMCVQILDNYYNKFKLVAQLFNVCQYIVDVDLLIPRTQTKLGERSFRISALMEWNSLPYSLKHSATNISEKT